MQAETRTPETKTPYAEQFAYLKVAIWRIAFRNRYPVKSLPPGRYRKILIRLNKSLERAQAIHDGGDTTSVPGGNALRLSIAIMSMEYRLLYPDDLQLRLIEERDAAHLKWYHFKKHLVGKHYVQAAIETYIELRETLLGPIPVPADKKRDIFQPDPFLKALRSLDNLVQSSPRLRRREIFKEIFPAIATAKPNHRTLLTAVCKAAYGYALWLEDPVAIASIRKPEAFDSHLLTVQQQNRAYLGSEEGKPLNLAIEKLLVELRRPLS